jgi:hypothetical protein
MPYDVFLSHNSKEKPLVRPLYAWLRDNLGKHRIFFDEAELGLGQVIPGGLEGALNECRCALVCYGPKGTGPWHEQELWSLLTKAIERSHHGKDS